MIVARRTNARTSVRQVIVALYERVVGFEDLSCPLALDVVAALGAVNGFSLAMVCTDPAAAREIGAELPAGVDLRVHTPGIDEPTAVFFARDYADHGFERIILVAADTIGLTARILSTTSSVLAEESPIIGSTPSNGLYLVGVNDVALRRADADSSRALQVISSGERPLKLKGRRLDRLARMSDLSGVAEVREAAAGHERQLPRVLARLAAREA